MSFEQKTIVDESLSEILLATRQRKNLSIEKVAKAARINVNYLRALEDGDYKALPKGLYAKKFLKTYCYYLELDSKKIITLYDHELAVLDRHNTTRFFSHKRVTKTQLFSLPKIIHNSILVIVILLFFIFIGYRVSLIIASPVLDVSFPPYNYTSTTTALSVVGVSDSRARLFINDVEVIIDEQGNFVHGINLQQGINTLQIIAQKKYGRDTTVIRQILVNPEK